MSTCTHELVAGSGLLSSRTGLLVWQIIASKPSSPSSALFSPLYPLYPLQPSLPSSALFTLFTLFSPLDPLQPPLPSSALFTLFNLFTLFSPLYPLQPLVCPPAQGIYTPNLNISPRLPTNKPRFMEKATLRYMDEYQQAKRGARINVVQLIHGTCACRRTCSTRTRSGRQMLSKMRSSKDAVLRPSEPPGPAMHGKRGRRSAICGYACRTKVSSAEV